MNTFIGFLVSSVMQVSLLAPLSNSVAFIPETLPELTEYLQEATDNDLVPIIVINQYYRDQGKFVYRPPADLRQAIVDSGYIGKIGFMLDEIFWHGTRGGQTADEVDAVFNRVRADFPTVDLIHIEAYAELYAQYMKDGNITLLDGANHFGFNCYGSFTACGDDEIPLLPQVWYLSLIQQYILDNELSAKLFLVPGAFQGPAHQWTELEILRQLQDYKVVLDSYPDLISGYGIFTAGTGPRGDLVGAEDLPLVSMYLKYIMPSILSENK